VHAQPHVPEFPLHEKVPEHVQPELQVPAVAEQQEAVMQHSPGEQAAASRGTRNARVTRTNAHRKRLIEHLP